MAAAGVSSPDNRAFVVMGGETEDKQSRKEIYQIRCSNGDCAWTELDEQLLIARSYLSAFAKTY